MSRRETHLGISLQQWRGVDQRTSPLRVQEGFFVMSRGVYFGLGDNAERIPGKTLTGTLDKAVVQAFGFGDVVFIQGLGKLWMIDQSSVFSPGIIFQPSIPPAPALSNIGTNTIDITMPASYPDYTLSFTIQRSLDNLTWSTIATGFATLQVKHNTGLLDNTTYYYRLIAVGAAANTTGPASNATTTAIATANRVTEAGDTRVTEAGETRQVDS